jgi:hypothetical protein
MSIKTDLATLNKKMDKIGFRRLWHSIVVWAMVLFQTTDIHAQVYYGLTNTGQLFTFSAGSCTACPVGPLNGLDPSALFTNGDFLVLPNGNIVITTGSQIITYSPPSPNPVSVVTVSSILGSAISPGGVIYMAGNNSPANLYTFNPATNALTLIGTFPPGVTAMTDMFYVGNQLYGLSFGGSVWQINTTNPSASVLLGTNLNNDLPTADGGFFLGDNFGVPVYAQFNPTVGDFTVICTLPAGSPVFISIHQVPVGAPQPPPCGGCITNAGTVNTTPITRCIPASVTVPYNNNPSLDPNDLLQYVVVSDPANPAGSIVVSGNSATIAYNAGLFTPGVTYYLGTVAGNNTGGNVNLSDPCLDFSNFAPVVWQPLPAVTFASTAPSACAGECETLQATFTGTPPFTLEGQVFFNSVVINNLNQSFSGNSGSFVLCTPPSQPSGALTFTAIRVTDAFCTCE